MQEVSADSFDPSTILPHTQTQTFRPDITASSQEGSGHVYHTSSDATFYGSQAFTLPAKELQGAEGTIQRSATGPNGLEDEATPNDSPRDSSDSELPSSKRIRPNSFAASASNYSIGSTHFEASPQLARNTTIPQPVDKTSPYKLSDVIRPADSWDDSVGNIVEAMLLRYFIESLSRWFDLNDPSKYFRITVPQRARTCQPLMNAVLTASARHMTRVKRFRRPDGVIRYDQRDLPGLTTETALHFHNECIRDLINSSSGLKTMCTEDFLAAAIILRFYEEVDAPLRDEERDSQLFRQMAMAFFRTRPDVSSPDYLNASPTLTTHSAAGDILGHSPSKVTNSFTSELTITAFPSASGHNNHTPQSASSEQPHATIDRPHQAPYWVALRQEIHHSFMNQRAFLVPLPKV